MTEKAITKNPVFYRKFTGVSQSSALKTLTMRVDEQEGTIRLFETAGSGTPLLTLTIQQFLEWSPHKILNKAGVKINEQAGTY